MYNQHGNEDIVSNELEAHEPVGISIGGHKLCMDDRQQEDQHQEGVEGKRQLFADGPANKGDDRDDEDSDLDRRAQSNADGQVHLVLGRHKHGRDVLACIPGDGHDDQPNEGDA